MFSVFSLTKRPESAAQLLVYFLKELCFLECFCAFLNVSGNSSFDETTESSINSSYISLMNCVF